MPKAKIISRPSTKGGKKYYTYYVRIPHDFVDILGLKEGDEVEVKIMRLNINGKERFALVYYKP